MKYKPSDIFTPQGLLSQVEKNPNLDFLMNIFNIPRAFGVSGFGGGWNVGMHSVATAFIALYWARFNKFSPEKRNELVTHALLHDIHESVTGDILPMFKEAKVKKDLDEIQTKIIKALRVKWKESCEVDLKVCDLISFLYEIKQVSPNILQIKKLALAKLIAEKQRIILFNYAKEKSIHEDRLKQFLRELEL